MATHRKFKDGEIHSIEFKLEDGKKTEVVVCERGGGIFYGVASQKTVISIITGYITDANSKNRRISFGGKGALQFNIGDEILFSVSPGSAVLFIYGEKENQ